ncbi:MAG: glycosyltransferase, partial [Chitinivibrionales bacterium]|nr:glycosyltransferase [Chitinivibrionales bacterium]
MRIGFDAKRIFYNRSGLGNYGRSLMRMLHTYFPQEYYYLFTPSVTNAVWQPDIPVTVVTPKRFLDRLMPDYWRCFSVCSDIAADRIDLFHGLNNELPFGSNRLKAKRVMTVHDLIFIRYPHYYNIIDRFIYEKKSRYSLAITDRVIADSIQTKSDLVNFFHLRPEIIEVIYLNCNPL